MTAMVTRMGMKSTHDLTAEVASFPAPEVCDALVAYFQHIRPFIPVISMPEFLERYRTPDQPLSLLLLQAVLMAGTHACSHPLVSSNRYSVKNILFRRASMLFHTHHETDRIHLMQAAALFTWHVGDGDTVAGGPWYWFGIAVRIGCGLGTHQYSTGLLAKERAPILALLVVGLCLRKTLGTLIPPPGADVGLDFLNRMVELAYIGLYVLAANAPSLERLVDISSINARLGLCSLQSGILSVTEKDFPWTHHPRMHYNFILLHLHRDFDDISGSQTVRSTVAQLAAQHALQQCPFTRVSAVTAAGIQLAGEIRTAVATRTFLIAIPALERLATLLRCTSMLALYWPAAHAVHSIFKEAHQEYDKYVTQNLQGEQVSMPETLTDWNRLFAGSQMLQQVGTDQE
ncbi:hypothetical protein ASPZODRAFT_15183 [Penicilliopsis zonata CBS 506.65]|uniref:Xylanolytic transcriptional activator regulatory domain-containing protein n=1 Tax=Penicilliopsis zonata CBS 506.65 TaxID=1073090 RepID=A0A1L9SKX5_9EURO|nr:hypothetical protein ASPZODRAFT_15183 [Penicilliopsis zonata CBS 506.65]OJJ47734.1 hypothetical protein ASPZODRAFT_15183 [Penicilliopsis zonata CBS 506.65]